VREERVVSASQAGIKQADQGERDDPAPAQGTLVKEAHENGRIGDEEVTAKCLEAEVTADAKMKSQCPQQGAAQCQRQAASRVIFPWTVRQATEAKEREQIDRDNDDGQDFFCQFC